MLQKSPRFGKILKMVSGFQCDYCGFISGLIYLFKGEMMMSLLWYYRPEHTEQGRQINDCPDEVFASKHQDHNSVACIEDKCYVLTFNEYCR